MPTKGYIAPTVFLPLTPGQIKFLRIVMQDYMDVSADVEVRKRARAIKKKLDILPPITSEHSRSKSS